MALNGETNGYQKLSMLIPIELRGKAITLGFRLAALPLGSGADRVRPPRFRLVRLIQWVA